MRERWRDAAFACGVNLRVRFGARVFMELRLDSKGQPALDARQCCAGYRLLQQHQPNL
jgi:hypothetical protein